MRAFIKARKKNTIAASNFQSTFIDESTFAKKQSNSSINKQINN
jgi:hypothetical protein